VAAVAFYYQALPQASPPTTTTKLLLSCFIPAAIRQDSKATA